MAGNTQTRSVADLIGQGVLSINDGYRAKNSELADHGIPFARAQNINNGFHFEDADRFPEAALDNIGNKISEPGDVVFTSKGTVGRLAFVRIDTPRFVYAPQLCFWRSLQQSVLEPRWLYYWMHSREFFVQYKGVAGQTDMADYVSLGDQRRMSMTLPPLTAQRAIAHILGTLDDKIELNRRMNETLEAMARAIFKSWFVDFDPVRAKAEGKLPSPSGRGAGGEGLPGLPKPIADLFPDSFEDSELGEIPKGWQTLSLYDTADYVNGLAFRNEDFCDRGMGLPVIKIAELKNGIVDQTKYTNKECDSSCHIDTGDLLYSWSGSPDTSLDVFVWASGPGWLNQHIFKVNARSEAERTFVYYLLRHLRPVLVEIARNKQTTGLGHVTVADMKRLLIVYPSQEVLSAFQYHAGPLFSRCFQNQLQNATLATLRDALLPKLLCGAITVKTAARLLKEIV